MNKTHEETKLGFTYKVAPFTGGEDLQVTIGGLEEAMGIAVYYAKETKTATTVWMVFPSGTRHAMADVIPDSETQVRIAFTK